MENKYYHVYMVCKVHKLVTCTGGTAEETWADPWEYAVDELETDMVDWEVERVEGIS